MHVISRNKKRAQILLDELLAQDTSAPSIDIDQTEALRKVFNSAPMAVHFETLEQLRALLKGQGDNRFPVFAFPVDNQLTLRISDWDENLRQTRFAVPRYYLRADPDFFVEAAEETTLELRSPPRLRALLREWRGAAEIAAGDEPYRCVFVWPASIRER